MLLDSMSRALAWGDGNRGMGFRFPAIRKERILGYLENHRLISPLPGSAGDFSVVFSFW